MELQRKLPDFPSFSPLLAVITDQIRLKGPMLFSDFMRLALYHPDYGYYERSLKRIGQSGDFVTSVSCGPLFGGLLLEYFARGTVDWIRSDVSSLQWVEVGAHGGLLAGDVLNHCQNAHPHLYSKLSYHIIEPSAARRQAQEALLVDHSQRIYWHRSWDEVPQHSIQGMIFSNELLDAFPVDKISWDAEQQCWYPWSVTIQNDQLTWCRAERPYPSTLDTFQATLPSALLQCLPHGFTTELGTEARDWWRQAAERLDQGCLLCIDYGLTQSEFLAPHRHRGTLRAYSRHHQNIQLLDNPGDQDLTAHVNFSAIEAAGKAAGLTEARLQSQESFLTDTLKRIIAENPKSPLLSPGHLRQFKTLSHPNHFGRSFSVFSQQR